jgi:malate dehydrogenase (oxaloacetate-decarboxylating)(NADP+)
MLDTGTEREELLTDALYIGLQHRRVRGAAYDALVDEFVAAVAEVFPRALIQFEDFATANALALLERYRDRIASFNDDVQGTAAVVLAALLAAGRSTGIPLAGQRLVFLGAGAAATGIASLVVQAMVEAGLPLDQARDRCWMVDEHGLVTADLPDLPKYQRPFAARHAPLPDLLSVIGEVRPTAIIGVSGHAGGFTQAVVHRMAEINRRPVILALSNPTSHSECTAEEAYRWSEGTAIFASGSPFGPVSFGPGAFIPAQANNAYIFPGIGLGVLLSGARRITDAMFAAAAGRLASLVSGADLARGTLLPPLRDIREISTHVAVAVIEVAQREGTAVADLPPDLEALVRRSMYQPEYASYV